jgi:hypothetical protein
MTTNHPAPAEPADHIRNGTEMVAPPAEGGSGGVGEYKAN